MSPRQIGVIAVPLVLVPTMWLAFRTLGRRYEPRVAYLLGFVLYGSVWCLAIPAMLLGGARAVIDLFSPVPDLTELEPAVGVALAAPIAFPLIFVFVPKIRHASVSVAAGSLALGTVIAVTEEILWRGLFARAFPANVWLRAVYPSALFALWHLAPQTLVPNRQRGGAASFVAYAFVLGMAYAFTVDRTGSIAWCTVSHAIHDTLGLGGFAFAASLRADSRAG